MVGLLRARLVTLILDLLLGWVDLLVLRCWLFCGWKVCCWLFDLTRQGFCGWCLNRLVVLGGWFCFCLLRDMRVWLDLLVWVVCFCFCF